MLAFGPGEIIEQILNGRLQVVAVCEALIKIVEHVPLLVRVPHETSALASESPMEGINHCRAENGGVSHNKSLSVVFHNLHRPCPQEEGLLLGELYFQDAAAN